MIVDWETLLKRYPGETIGSKLQYGLKKHRSVTRLAAAIGTNRVTLSAKLSREGIREKVSVGPLKLVDGVCRETQVGYASYLDANPIYKEGLDEPFDAHSGAVHLWLYVINNALQHKHKDQVAADFLHSEIVEQVMELIGINIDDIDIDKLETLWRKRRTGYKSSSKSSTGS